MDPPLDNTSANSHNYWSRALSLLLIISLSGMAFVLGGQAKHGTVSLTDQVVDALRVHRLIVVDEHGVERVIIGAPVPDPIIDGETYARRSPASGILLFDRDGQERGGFNTFEDGSVALAIDHQKGGHEAVGIYVFPDGRTGLLIFDREGRGRAQLSVSRDESSSLALYDVNKTLRIMLQTDGQEDGPVFIRLVTPAGETVYERKAVESAEP